MFLKLMSQLIPVGWCTNLTIGTFAPVIGWTLTIWGSVRRAQAVRRTFSADSLRAR
jgi:hypothetical protein